MPLSPCQVFLGHRLKADQTRDLQEEAQCVPRFEYGLCKPKTSSFTPLTCRWFRRTPVTYASDGADRVYSRDSHYST